MALLAYLAAQRVESVDATAPASALHAALKRLAAARLAPLVPRVMQADVGRAIAARTGERGTELLRVLATQSWGAAMARILLALAPKCCNASYRVALQLTRARAHTHTHA